MIEEDARAVQKLDTLKRGGVHAWLHLPASRCGCAQLSRAPNLFSLTTRDPRPVRVRHTSPYNTLIPRSVRPRSSTTPKLSIPENGLVARRARALWSRSSRGTAKFRTNQDSNRQQQ